MVILIFELIVVSLKLTSKILYLFLFQFNMWNDQSKQFHRKIFILKTLSMRMRKERNKKKVERKTLTLGREESDRHIETNVIKLAIPHHLQPESSTESSSEKISINVPGPFRTPMAPIPANFPMPSRYQNPAALVVPNYNRGRRGGLTHEDQLDFAAVKAAPGKPKRWDLYYATLRALKVWIS